MAALVLVSAACLHRGEYDTTPPTPMPEGFGSCIYSVRVNPFADSVFVAYHPMPCPAKPDSVWIWRGEANGDCITTIFTLRSQRRPMVLSDSCLLGG
jgi:hypothetical protein